MTLHTDTQAQFECPEGLICGTAIYEIRDDYAMDTRAVDLVSMRIGQLVLTRYQLVDAVGEATVSAAEEYVSATECLPDPMGDAADADFDRHGWAAE